MFFFEQPECVFSLSTVFKLSFSFRIKSITKNSHYNHYLPNILDNFNLRKCLKIKPSEIFKRPKLYASKIYKTVFNFKVASKALSFLFGKKFTIIETLF